MTSFVILGNVDFRSEDKFHLVVDLSAKFVLTFRLKISKFLLFTLPFFGGPVSRLSSVGMGFHDDKELQGKILQWWPLEYRYEV